MRTLGNILWFIVFGGIIQGTFYILIGCLFCLTIIGIPIGKAMFQYGKLMYFPFGKEIVRETFIKGKENVSVIRRVFGVIANIIWFPFGLAIFLANIGIMVACFVTIIFIPVGIVIARSCFFLLAPIGAKVITKEEKQAIIMSNTIQNRGVMVQQQRTNTVAAPVRVGPVTGPMQLCQRCGAAFSALSRFCESCGAHVMAVVSPPQGSVQSCTRCGAVYSATLNFCEKCGTPAMPRVEPPPVVLSIDPPPAPVLICVQCGAILSDTSRFCDKCGTPIAVAPPLNTTPPPTQGLPPIPMQPPPVAVAPPVPAYILPDTEPLPMQPPPVAVAPPVPAYILPGSEPPPIAAPPPPIEAQPIENESIATRLCKVCSSAIPALARFCADCGSPSDA